jgi:hypothetical protein
MKVLFKLMFVMCAFPGAAVAQNGSPTDSLAQVARQALNNLDYDRAGQVARVILQDEQATREARIEGLQILAAAFFPEEDGAQQPDSATKYMRSLLELAPGATMPSDISWPGLDAMLDATGRTVFFARATPEAEYVLHGVDAQAVIPVVATRAARFKLEIKRPGAARMLVDSSGAATSTGLRFTVAEYNGVSMPGGDYEFWITATDSVTGRTVEMGFHAFVEAPPVGLVPIPVALDSSQLLPERTNRNRLRNTVIGIGLGAATGFIATAFRGSDPVSNIGLDNRAYVMGGGMTLGGIIGVLTDRAAPVPANIAHNAQIRADHSEFVRLSRDQNDQRRLSYRAAVTVRGRIQ